MLGPEEQKVPDVDLLVLLQALDIVSDAVIITNESGKVLYQNKNGEEFHKGLTTEEVAKLLEGKHGSWKLMDSMLREVHPTSSPIELFKKSLNTEEYVVQTPRALIMARYTGQPVGPIGGRCVIVTIKRVREIVD